MTAKLGSGTRRILIGCAIVVAVFASFAAATGAAAQARYNGWGVQGGFSLDPEQFVLGTHIDFGQLAPHLHLRPNADLGLGDNFVILTINPDLTYGFVLENRGVLHVGGTMGLIYWSFDPPGRLRGTDGFDLGLAAVLAYDIPSSPVFLNMKLGLVSEYPDLKFMVGYTFAP